MSLDKKHLMVLSVTAALFGFLGGMAHAAWTHLREPHGHKAHHVHEGNDASGDNHIHQAPAAHFPAHVPLSHEHKAHDGVSHPEDHHRDSQSHGAHVHHEHHSGSTHPAARKNDDSDSSDSATDSNDEPGHHRQHDDSNTQGAAGSTQPTMYAECREPDRVPPLEPAAF